MNSKTIFITGTGTDIGKTIVTAGIASISISMGYSTATMKPVQTGSDDYQPDLEVISNIVPNLHKLPAELATPYSFKLAASPHLASKEEGVIIDPKLIIKRYKKSLTHKLDLLLLEGAGGVYVPLTENYLMVDLISELKPKVIITALAGLGTINHTLLTVEALKRAGIEIMGIVINMFPEKPSLIEEDNLKIIEQISQTPILAVIKKLNIDNNNISNLIAEEFDSQVKLKESIKDLYSKGK